MYKGLKVLDVHAHLSAGSPATHGRVSLMMAMNTPLQSHLSGGGGAAGLGPSVSQEQLHEAVAGHVAYIDERNIDVQVVGPRPFTTFGWMPPHLIPSWARWINDLIAQQCQFFPDRFLGACQLPQVAGAPDTVHCLEELDRCVGEYGFVAAYLSPDPDGRRTAPGLSEPYWYPLYERCQERGLAIIVHGTNSLDHRIAAVPQNYQLGFVVEEYIAGEVLSHSDVFDRFPELKVIICHCGGALTRFIPSSRHLAQRDLSANLFFDTCGYDVDFLQTAIRQHGVDQMCFGVEAPGSGREVRPETGRTSDDLIPVLEQFDWLSDGDRAKILHHNPARVVPALGKLGQ